MSTWWGMTKLHTRWHWVWEWYGCLATVNKQHVIAEWSWSSGHLASLQHGATVAAVCAACPVAGRRAQGTALPMNYKHNGHTW